MRMFSIFHDFERKKLVKKFYFENHALNVVVTIAPWISVFLIVISFLSLESRVAVQKGMTLEVPELPADNYIKPEMVAVIVMSAGVSSAEQGGVVFFDNERFAINRMDHLNKLKKRLHERSQLSVANQLVLLIDESVNYKVIATLIKTAREAGIKKIVFSSR